MDYTKIKEELNDLVDEGNRLINKLKAEKDNIELDFHLDYQKWYTLAIKIVKLLGSDRYDEFKSYYEIDPKRKSLSYGTYVIQDFMKGVVPSRSTYSNFNSITYVMRNIFNQVNIISSLISRIDSVIANMDFELQADIFDSELETANRLVKVNSRAAGAICGVVIEKHLNKVIERHGHILRKKNPGIGDMNEILKSENVYDTIAWRKISYLADIRNICVHNKTSNPTEEQVFELVEGANWIIKNIY